MQLQLLHLMREYLSEIAEIQSEQLGDFPSAVATYKEILKCIEDNGNCDKEDYCPLRDLMTMAEHRLVEVFESHTLLDLIKWQKAKSMTV